MEASRRRWRNGLGAAMARSGVRISRRLSQRLAAPRLASVDDVVLHIHDEIVLEVPEDDAEAAAERLVQIMCEPPPWASGLPLNAEVAIMETIRQIRSKR